MPELQVAVLGLGQVGQALCEQLRQEDGVAVVSATDTSGTLVDPDGLDLGGVVAAKRAEGSVLAGPGRATSWTATQAAARAPADVVVQLTPSDLKDPRGSLAEVQAALAAGRDVVTAAKAAPALRPVELAQSVATSRGRLVKSAAVAGSVPVLETLQTAFRGDRIERIDGVLNGSTTRVLSAMEAGSSRETALALAREEGLLEADPTHDLTGLDAGAKAALLHQVAYGSQLSLDEVSVDGIGGIDEAACRAAEQRGFAIRLLARVDEEGARVAPVEVPVDGPFGVTGPQVALRIVLAGAGSIVLKGPGAGPQETASAVRSDLIGLREKERADGVGRVRLAA